MEREVVARQATVSFSGRAQGKLGFGSHGSCDRHRLHIAFTLSPLVMECRTLNISYIIACVCIAIDIAFLRPADQHDWSKRGNRSQTVRTVQCLWMRQLEPNHAPSKSRRTIFWQHLGFVSRSPTHFNVPHATFTWLQERDALSGTSNLVVEDLILFLCHDHSRAKTKSLEAYLPFGHSILSHT